jgi:hypothetical protein
MHNIFVLINVLIFIQLNIVINELVLDLLLHVQSVAITTNVVISNPVHDEVYSIKFVSDLRQVGGFLHQQNWPPW